MPFTWEIFGANLQQVLDTSPTDLVLRRGETTLPAQQVRIERTSGSSPHSSVSAVQPTTAVIILGDKTLDIQRDDRFVYANRPYVVKFVRPNRLAVTMAEADLQE